MHPNAALLQRFYEAFQRKDAETMAACYHPHAEFSDPAFPGLQGKKPGHMWRMLCERGKDLQLVFSDISADDHNGSARWVANYSFSATGRKVENRIQASFEFKDGLIYRHRDHFDFWRWSSQALGFPGKLLGWSRFLQNKVSARARKQLDAYIAQRGLS
jgi:ketosteroid isomerase-like protein